jgi:uncharacterized protein YjaZ
MQSHKITTSKNSKKITIGSLHLFTEYSPSLVTKKLITSFLRDIPHSKGIGYAGFGKKEYLKDSLLYNIPANDDKSIPFEISTKKIISVIEKALHLCHKHVTTPPTTIFLFPTFSDFVKDKMGGVSGYTPYKNTLLLFVSPIGTRHWERALTETICHEFMHTVMDNHYERKDLLDDLVFEGIAESFVSFHFGERPDMPSQALSEKEALEWYRKLKKRSRNTKLYYSVFLEGKEFPLWAGYAIGYRLFETYRSKHRKVTWNEVVHLTPREILVGSGFGE